MNVQINLYLNAYDMAQFKVFATQLALNLRGSLGEM